MKKLSAIMSMVLIIAFLIAGCASGDDSKSTASNKSEEKELTKITIGTQPWIGYGPWWIAEAEGIFEKHNIDAELTTFIQDTDLNAAFASKKIQVANIATHTGMKLAANNSLDISMITFMDESLSADAIITREEIKNFEDLKGKKIAFEEGTTSDLLFRQAVIDHKMKMEDFEIVHMPASDAGLALLSNKVDAAVTYEPYISSILKKDPNVRVIYSGENSPGLISDVAVVYDSLVKENPELIKTLQQVWDEAIDFWKENPERGNEIIANESGTDEDQLPPILDGIQFFKMDEQRKMVQSGDLVDKLKNIKGILKSQDGLDKDVKVEELIAIE